jgi:hypothetical protein
VVAQSTEKALGRSVPSDPTTDAAFYAVADAEHFIGLVGLINSIRLVGHSEAIVVTDLGMSPRQRRLVASVATIVDPPFAMHGVLAKPVGPLAHPAEVMVLLDADVLLVRHLQPLIDRARAGELVFFENNVPDRFFREWESLGLGAPRRAAYVIAGHFLGPRALLVPILRELDRLQAQLPAGAAHFAGGTISDPLFFADQDLLNAYLMTSVDPAVITRLSGNLSPVPPFTGLQRGQGLSCLGPDGVEPYLLHHIHQKPWIGATKRTIYAELLRDVLWHSDSAIVLDPREVPLRLRPSRLGSADLVRASVQWSLGAALRGELSFRPLVARNAKRLSRIVSPSRGR